MASERGGRDWREDLHASVAARRDLGPAYEAELVASFLDRVDRDLDERIDARLQPAPEISATRGKDDSGAYGFVLGLVSLGTGIPLTAIAGENGLAGVVASWLGIVGVNAAHAYGQRARRQRR